MKNASFSLRAILAWHCICNMHLILFPHVCPPLHLVAASQPAGQPACRRLHVTQDPQSWCGQAENWRTWQFNFTNMIWVCLLVSPFVLRMNVVCILTCRFNIITVRIYCHPYCLLPLPSARQHPSYDDCLQVKREYYQNSSVLDCVTQCSQSTAHLCEQFLQVQTDWVCHIGTLMPCIEAVA